MLDRFEPEWLVFEGPILVHKSKHSQRNDKLEDVARMLALTGHVEFVCHRRGIECRRVDLRKVKKELAGFGQADKDDMVAAAEKIGLRLPASPKRAREDASDAFGAWLLLLRARYPSLSARFDSALYGRRGALL
jgi:Holliday junction resolvasome RuvABC endonuclease subunit